ncbi:glycosyltransferase [Sanyastnella coralliicola]|uniref:glycosyltransferase n=1 Tax=Sanyastnella coralliicola TaxID=3069118 RepID=UPI0027B8F691|nr:glycosyltransferase [Longitalea sp. SCSIO 12813]
MKIVIVSVFPPFRGGIAQFNEHMMSALVDQGHEVHAINFKRQYPQLIFPGKTQYLDDHREIANTPALLDSINPLSWKRTASHVNSLNADLVIIPYWTGYLAPALASVAHRCTAPVLGLLHNAIPHDAGSFQQKLGRRFIDACDRYITLSESVSNDLLRLRPNASVTQAFHPIYTHLGESLARNAASQLLGVDDDKKTLLFFGLIRPYKGLDVLLKAFNKLPSEYQLLVAGEAYEDQDKYEAMIDQAAKNRVVFSNGFIPDDEVNRWFSACDLVVLPYKSATQSGVTATALHFNKAIVASNVGGLSEYIDHESTGMLVPPLDETALSEAILRWFHGSDSALAREESIQKKKDQFSWKRFAQLITS